MPNVRTLNILKKATGYLQHPLTLSLIVTTIILLIFPINISKYKLDVIESLRQKSLAITVWDDLEHDGISDRILFTNYPSGFAGMAVYFYPSGRPKEWDIPGKLVNQYNNNCFVIDGGAPGRTKEIFTFTYSNDSLFLNRISDLSGQEPVWEQKFISKFNIVNGTNDVSIVTPRFDDLDNNDTTELIFGISAGFSLTPRALFIYDLFTDSLIRSIETGNSLMDFLIADINGDSLKEIITEGYAAKNILDTVVSFHDSSNWAMVFDHSLKLLFQPSEFKGRTGSIFPLAFPTTSTCKKLFILWGTPSDNQQGLQLFRITENGEKKFVKEFSEFDKYQTYQDYFLMNFKEDMKFVIPLKNGDMYLFDTTFKKHDVIPLHQQITYLKHKDIDQDGYPELLAFDEVLNTLTILRGDFMDPVKAPVEFAGRNFTTISYKKNNNNPTLICLSTGELMYVLSYQKNPLWFLRWGIWAVIWLSVFLFALLIRRIQRVQIEKRYAIEKKITELQMKIVRNQMDPHFTMNAVNSVIAAINQNEKEEATQHLLQFSKMYRHLVLTADKIKCTLAEELDFTKNYLAMEQFRFRDKFSFEVNIAPEVSLDWEVPKMVIQSPVENAVKHGLLNLPGKGYLKISAKTTGSHLILGITDNGIGRKKASGLPGKSTGKGMKAMEEFLRLYQKTTGIKVETTIVDLTDPEGKPAGTKVEIMIEVEKSEARIGSEKPEVRSPNASTKDECRMTKVLKVVFASYF